MREWMSTRKEVVALVRVFESCLEDTVIEHLAEEGYFINFGSVGRFIVHYRPAIRRKIGFNGEVRDLPPRRKVEFIGLGRLRKLERLR